MGICFLKGWGSFESSALVLLLGEPLDTLSTSVPLPVHMLHMIYVCAVKPVIIGQCIVYSEVYREFLFASIALFAFQTTGSTRRALACV